MKLAVTDWREADVRGVDFVFGGEIGVVLNDSDGGVIALSWLTPMNCMCLS
jgi:hypothetical protein